ncbi:hypothetical protein [Jiella avicenniae]|uniref:Uncharacterized protein n=1 Tax=Jiella avicenniae TaxID=2907202 RepID=A0A9X1T9P4_9HYPH|nr:hypothetical protein [Jiella avicenniae]MCE7026518.1 hypothetical protein [Jiella avicenniae]
MAWMAIGELCAVLFGIVAGWYFLVYRDPATGRHGRGSAGPPREQDDEGGEARRRRDD